VTVTVQPPYPGVTVYLSSSVSGLDPSCNVPIGVFGDPEGETDSEGTFTTTYKAGLDVGAETIYADVSDAFDNLFTDEASLGVTGTCGNRADRIAYEYVLKNVTTKPACGEFTQSGDATYFSWAELNGRGPASSQPYGNLHYPLGEWGLVRESLGAGLEATRAIFGGRLIALTSGYRDPCGNAGIPGVVPHSLHMQGRAPDMFPAGHRGDALKLDTLWYAAEAAGGWGRIRYGDDPIHVQW